MMGAVKPIHHNGSWNICVCTVKRIISGMITTIHFSIFQSSTCRTPPLSAFSLPPPPYSIILTCHTPSTLFNCVCMCVSWAHHFVFISMAWRVMSHIENQSSLKLVCKKMTYSATISARSGSDQATAVSCKGQLRASWVLFYTTALSTGGLKMVKLEVATQLTLQVWCCLLAMNTMFSPSSSGLSPWIAPAQLVPGRRPRFWRPTSQYITMARF
jgi:hypothetical protein